MSQKTYCSESSRLGVFKRPRSLGSDNWAKQDGKWHIGHGELEDTIFLVAGGCKNGNQDLGVNVGIKENMVIFFNHKGDMFANKKEEKRCPRFSMKPTKSWSAKFWCRRWGLSTPMLRKARVNWWWPQATKGWWSQSRLNKKIWKRETPQKKATIIKDRRTDL